MKKRKNNPSSPKDSLALSARASSEKTCRSPNHSPSSLLSCPTSSTNVCGTHNDASVFLGDQIVNYDPAWRVELCDKKCDINCDIKCFHFLPLSLSPEPVLLCLQIEESDKWIKVTEKIPQAALFSYTITHCRILKDPKVSELLCGLFFLPLSPFSNLFNSE